jgi:hypothetical protein
MNKQTAFMVKVADQVWMDGGNFVTGLQLLGKCIAMQSELHPLVISRFRVSPGLLGYLRGLMGK